MTLLLAHAQAQDADLQLRCKGTVESAGSKFPTNVKSEEFDLKVNRATGRASGGYAELITESERFSSRATDVEFEGDGTGKTVLPDAHVYPIGFYKLNRSTGSFVLSVSLMFSKDQTYVEYRVRATCEEARKKF